MVEVAVTLGVSLCRGELAGQTRVNAPLSAAPHLPPPTQSLLPLLAGGGSTAGDGGPGGDGGSGGDAWGEIVAPAVFRASGFTHLFLPHCIYILRPILCCLFLQAAAPQLGMVAQGATAGLAATPGVSLSRGESEGQRKTQSHFSTHYLGLATPHQPSHTHSPLALLAGDDSTAGDGGPGGDGGSGGDAWGKLEP